VVAELQSRSTLIGSLSTPENTRGKIGLLIPVLTGDVSSYA
jgi:hypothetical protein